jgi:hypothetical protein
LQTSLSETSHDIKYIYRINILVASSWKIGNFWMTSIVILCSGTCTQQHLAEVNIFESLIMW